MMKNSNNKDLNSMTHATEQDYLARRKANETLLGDAGIYNPQMEHDNCGVGFVAAVDGKPSRAVVSAAIEALQSIWHRGAVDADGMTGDGAGIHIAIPRDFFIEHIARTGHKDDGGKLAVGMVFLPRQDLSEQETCRCIVEQEILRLGYQIYGWRQVPTDTQALGKRRWQHALRLSKSCSLCLLISQKKKLNASFSSFAAVSKKPYCAHK